MLSWRVVVSRGTRATARFSTCAPYKSHENPLGLPRSDAPPTIPRAQRGLPQKRRIPHVKQTIVVASGKGGVGKSTVAVNLAAALAKTASSNGKRVGVLDLDIFGPSVPKLLALDDVGEPELTSNNQLIPLSNYGIPCMSMAFLLPPAAQSDTPVVWRGMMVMKAVQQLLFDVDWRSRQAGETDLSRGQDLDLLVIDLPPGTGDVQLSLGQLVQCDVSTPQDVALIDVRKGVSMFRKIGIPTIGAVLNMSHYICPSCDEKHPLFGSPDRFTKACKDVQLDVLGHIPLEPKTSQLSDAGQPLVLSAENDSVGKATFIEVAQKVWHRLEAA